MIRNTLLKEVEINGRDAFGKTARVVLSPIGAPGIYWNADGTDVPLDKVCITAHPYLHCLKLSHKKAELYVPEHLLGYLYAAGVDGVRISASRLPYDGCAVLFHKMIGPQLKRSGVFSCVTPTTMIEIPVCSGRSLEIHPSEETNQTRTLVYRIVVNYESIGESILEGDLDQIDIAALSHARPYGRPVLKVLSQIFGRKDQFVWFEQNEGISSQEKLEEIATHRLLDLLGALLCVTPKGTRLAGRIISPQFANHQSDMLLVEELRVPNRFI
ncbi:MAG: UDP-3-O-acyl-N-acetylglucosamine deacetylase [Candidatus Pacebacteria bacterium]|nr:UDP-3-O-acyl-N-acetylglucosamine deacetylase [Candidatus Paceibacterota bacterium]